MKRNFPWRPNVIWFRPRDFFGLQNSKVLANSHSRRVLLAVVVLALKGFFDHYRKRQYRQLSIRLVADAWRDFPNKLVHDPHRLPL